LNVIYSDKNSISYCLAGLVRPVLVKSVSIILTVQSV